MIQVLACKHSKKVAFVLALLFYADFLSSAYSQILYYSSYSERQVKENYSPSARHYYADNSDVDFFYRDEKFNEGNDKDSLYSSSKEEGETRFESSKSEKDNGAGST